MSKLFITTGTIALLAMTLLAPARSDDSTDACIQGPIVQFGQYVGDGRIADESLAQDDNGWDWAMEMSFDAGETWTEVYRIKASPWDGSAE